MKKEIWVCDNCKQEKEWYKIITVQRIDKWCTGYHKDGSPRYMFERVEEHICEDCSKTEKSMNDLIRDAKPQECRPV